MTEAEFSAAYRHWRPYVDQCVYRVAPALFGADVHDLHETVDDVLWRGIVGFDGRGSLKSRLSWLARRRAIDQIRVIERRHRFRPVRPEATEHDGFAWVDWHDSREHTRRRFA